MKKFILGTILSFFTLALVVVPAFAAKPADNNAGAQKINWNLSGAVMPVPPYGLSDITGSDTASKLIVNQPNGKVAANLTGVMNGLNPNTTYTVYLANGYTPYAITGWNVTGTWNFGVVSTVWPGTYPKTMTISQDLSGNITGTGYNAPSGNTWTVTGSVAGSVVNFLLTYDAPMSGYTATFSGNIQPDGTMSGNWFDVLYGDTGTWNSTSGAAVKTYTGDTWFTGLFTTTVPPFTFMTDELGAGSWHLNLRDANFPEGTGPFSLSVWINGGGGTILISNSFTITK